jgi:hypothetical protein
MNIFEYEVISRLMGESSICKLCSEKEQEAYNKINILKDSNVDNLFDRTYLKKINRDV